MFIRKPLGVTTNCAKLFLPLHPIAPVIPKPKHKAMLIKQNCQAVQKQPPMMQPVNSVMSKLLSSASKAAKIQVANSNKQAKTPPKKSKISNS